MKYFIFKMLSSALIALRLSVQLLLLWWWLLLLWLWWWLLCLFHRDCIDSLFGRLPRRGNISWLCSSCLLRSWQMTNKHMNKFIYNFNLRSFALKTLWISSKILLKYIQYFYKKDKTFITYTKAIAWTIIRKLQKIEKYKFYTPLLKSIMLVNIWKLIITQASILSSDLSKSLYPEVKVACSAVASSSPAKTW